MFARLDVRVGRGFVALPPPAGLAGASSWIWISGREPSSAHFLGNDSQSAGLAVAHRRYAAAGRWCRGVCRACQGEDWTAPHVPCRRSRGSNRCSHGRPDTATSEPPLAIVVESESELATDDLRELHRLSWNFSHAPTVITIEPTLLRVWSCCEHPDTDREIEDYQVECLAASDLGSDQSNELQAGAARALHWINLVSGQFFADHSPRFDRDGRADQMLLGNLRYMRLELQRCGLKDDDVCHDLLARVIFVQFLFHRKDHNGKPALTEAKLSSLQREGVLEKRHASI